MVECYECRRTISASGYPVGGKIYCVRCVKGKSEYRIHCIDGVMMTNSEAVRCLIGKVESIEDRLPVQKRLRS